MHAGDGHPVTRLDAPLLEVVGTITKGGMGAVNVVGPGARLLGIITDGDVRRMLHRCDPSELGERRAAEIMTREPVVIHPDAMAYDALKLMENRPSQIAVLPVVEHESCVGLVRLHDLVRIGL
jgi:arabinose-5-phosphate isomerase